MQIGKPVILLPRVKTNEPFNATGHFPIIAFRERSTDSPFYLALVTTQNDGIWIYAAVREGDSFATYLDFHGKVQVTNNFRVLVLRSDPVDFPYTWDWDKFRHREGALDPTGPVYWLQYFPERDPDMFENVEGNMPREMKEMFTSLNGRNEANSMSDTRKRHEGVADDSDEDQFENVEFSDEEDSDKDGTESGDEIGLDIFDDPLENVEDAPGYIGGFERLREDLEAPEVSTEYSEAKIGTDKAESVSSISERGFKTEDYLPAKENTTEKDLAVDPQGSSAGRQELEMERRALEIERRMLEIEERKLAIEKRDLEIKRQLAKPGEKEDRGD
ncbi:hypothetical protein SCHPADRAFT_1000827 [Schizopora paradoxa]|uniref:Uncharacterized protein n=1 Tax=Schizopora paradoxa TaxID=27342 RepID=A0A0H2RB38_9AGAM|nr:hypothetical protein SCHPADRAFT_1000827 [Schizopora paradoxa]